MKQLLTILILIISLQSFGQDIIKPVVSIISPVNGEEISGKRTFITNQSDNIGVVHTDLYYGTTLIFKDYTTPPHYIEWDTETVPNGTYIITAKSYDAAGNIGIATVSVNVKNANNHPYFRVWPNVDSLGNSWVEILTEDTVKASRIMYAPISDNTKATLLNVKYLLRKIIFPIPAIPAKAYYYITDKGVKYDIIKYYSPVFNMWSELN